MVGKNPDYNTTSNQLKAEVSEMSLKQEANKDPTLESAEIIKTNKFYSSKPSNSSSNQPQFQSPQNQNDTKKTPNKKEKSNRKAAERSKNAQLGNWQANLTSQLLLPEDFTPELISQLAAEGYDVVSAGGGRKARTKTQPQTSLANTIADSSDEEEEYNPSKSDTKSGTSSHKSNKLAVNTGVNYDEFKKSRINMGQMDLQDPTDHPSFKRFSQILDDLLESYEEDLQQIKLNNFGNKSTKAKSSGNKHDDDAASPTSEEEIPNEYLLPRQTCYDMLQEAFRLNSLSIMNLIKKENLSKLQNLLYFNIKDSRQAVRSLNDVRFLLSFFLKCQCGKVKLPTTFMF